MYVYVNICECIRIVCLYIHLYDVILYCTYLPSHAELPSLPNLAQEAPIAPHSP